MTISISGSSSLLSGDSSYLLEMTGRGPAFSNTGSNKMRFPSSSTISVECPSHQTANAEGVAEKSLLEMACFGSGNSGA